MILDAEIPHRDITNFVARMDEMTRETSSSTFGDVTHRSSLLDDIMLALSQPSADPTRKSLTETSERDLVTDVVNSTSTKAVNNAHLDVTDDISDVRNDDVLTGVADDAITDVTNDIVTNINICVDIDGANNAINDKEVCHASPIISPSVSSKDFTISDKNLMDRDHNSHVTSALEHMTISSDQVMTASSHMITTLSEETNSSDHSIMFSKESLRQVRHVTLYYYVLAASLLRILGQFVFG